MVAVDFKAALGNPTSIDHANIEIQGMRVSKTVKMGLFTTNENAVWAGDYLLAKESYPRAKVRLVVNRNLFRLQPGDPFVLKLQKYGITQMVCRVVFIEEEDIMSEKITVTAVEESVNATAPITSYTEPTNYRKKRTIYGVVAIENVKIVETPYALSGEEVNSVSILVPRMRESDAGYAIYMSQDGAEYYFWKYGDKFNVYGTLATAYPITSAIDDSVGMYVNFDIAQSTDLLQTISRTEMLGTRNLSLIGDEIITWQTITPITSTQYKLTGVYRGRWGTVNTSHSVGEKFYFVSNIITYEHYSFIPGATVYFKVIPYSRSGIVGSIASAEVFSHTFEGESYKPYEVINLKANGTSYYPHYDEENIVLTWTPRVRGDGTGIGVPSEIIPDTLTHEGHFRVEVLVGGSSVRTVEGLDVYTWTYTTAMNLSDNTSYPNYITFAVTNYIIGTNNVEYESDQTLLTVRQENLVSTTTTTTSTTTTT